MHHALGAMSETTAAAPSATAPASGTGATTASRIVTGCPEADLVS
jgi:hypothetical protein